MDETKTEFLARFSGTPTCIAGGGDLLRKFYVALLGNTRTMMGYRDANIASVADVRYAASIMGFQVPSAENSAIDTSNESPPDWFVEMTREELEKTFRFGILPKADVLKLLYLIYRGVEMGSVTASVVASPQRASAATAENDGGSGKRYALDSPVGVQAQFFQRELKFSDDEEDEEEEEEDVSSDDEDEEDLLLVESDPSTQ